MTAERGHRHRRRAPVGPGLAKIAAKAAIALLLAAAVVSITAAGVFRGVKPAWALSLATWDARARSAAAQQSLATARDPSALARAEREARAAFRRDPLAIKSMVTLGLVAALRGDERRASRIFRYVERLSRRDPEAQLWLIEQSVSRNDIEGALGHYDIVMRTEPQSWAQLQPILVNASSHQDIARALNRVLRDRPIWARDLLGRFAELGRDPLAIATVSSGVLDPRVEEDRLVLLQILDRLVSLRRFDLAWAAYRAAAPAGRGAPPLLRDGRFASDRGLPPFDWDFADDGRLNPERRPLDAAGSSFALYLPAAATIEGEAARQLLRLDPGAYQLSARVGDVPQNPLRRPYFKVACAGATERRIAQGDFPPATADGRAAAMRFTVPAGCRDLWLSIWVRGDIDEALGSAPWVAALALRRL